MRIGVNQVGRAEDLEVAHQMPDDEQKKQSTARSHDELHAERRFE
jgi:hypothetical protein